MFSISMFVTGVVLVGGVSFATILHTGLSNSKDLSQEDLFMPTRKLVWKKFKLEIIGALLGVALIISSFVLHS